MIALHGIGFAGALIDGSAMTAPTNPTSMITADLPGAVS
jgi:hypothetical protein